jgi:membrane-associated protease RseP (regulator of RpoE activity)
MGDAYLQLGEPLLFKLLSQAMYGNLEGQELMLHPLGYAGWIGLLLTALNLLPAGQLDGGHIAYAVFGPRVNRFFWLLVAALVAMSVYYWSFAYLLFLVLLVVFARRHPPPSDDVTPLDPSRKAVSVIPLIVLILSFTPVPIRLASQAGG